MRKKSWLRQASRDRRPRRTQSSMSPNYGGNDDDGGRNTREGAAGRSPRISVENMKG